jgi:hypothetical protein
MPRREGGKALCEGLTTLNTIQKNANRETSATITVSPETAAY